jgi:hypothetical protein
MRFVKLFAVLTFAALAGCSTLTPLERHGLEAAAIVVIAGSIAASASHASASSPTHQAVSGIGPELNR